MIRRPISHVWAARQLLLLGAVLGGSLLGSAGCIDTSQHACNDEHPCRDAQMCVQGQCVDLDDLSACTTHEDCPAGELCQSGYCVPGDRPAPMGDGDGDGDDDGGQLGDGDGDGDDDGGVLGDGDGDGDGDSGLDAGPAVDAGQTCGNGEIDDGETCDDGVNDGAYAGCEPGCAAWSPRCGDGNIDDAYGEGCDDGNTVDGDGCAGDCSKLDSCGDGTIQSGEACDDGAESDTCDDNCTVVACGDSTPNATAGEQCDTGTESASCDGDCTLVMCGDGRINAAAGEECEEGGVATASCDEDCTFPVCGDELLNLLAPETCDEGGSTATCDGDCTDPACGDGFLNEAFGEVCDEGGETANCDDDCTVASCGDGTVNAAAAEQCDDNGQSQTCDEDCTDVVCGDGHVNPLAAEQCDDSGFSADCDDDCTDAICGDGVTNALALEQCDGVGATVDCDDDCTLPVCGDGNVNPLANEQCDDVGFSADCDDDCTNVLCGDGLINPAAGETCDDQGESLTCDADCTSATCGDGVVNITAQEQCDDMGESQDCDDDCTTAFCGDGTRNLTRGEACDEAGDTATCDSDCTAPACGDGHRNLAAGEQCDDGGNVSGDGCDLNCQAEQPVCGDGTQDPGEQCDEAGFTATCDDDCTLPQCGDGLRNPFNNEDCDDNGESATCNLDCTFAACGDSIENNTAGEECDEGGNTATCDANCTAAVCGDSYLNTANNEQCDEGGNTPGCDADCTPAVCGDGFLNTNASEICDEGGNTPTCDIDCTPAECGDGLINTAAFETCDDSGESASCDADCTAAQCGDNTVNTTAGEACDDGGESATCDGDCTAVVCGDGIRNTTANEFCDTSGESINCDDDCTEVQCGDNNTNEAAGEECDTGGESATCDPDCSAVVCGDTYVNGAAGELCDDGTNDGSYNGCNPGCAAFGPRCGDGNLDPLFEACDDGAANGTTGNCAADCSADWPDPATTTLTGTSPVVANGVAASTVLITLLDAASNPHAGLVPLFTVGGTNNTVVDNCTASNASGVSVCTDSVSSTRAEVKTLQLQDPISLSGGTITFVAGPADQGNSDVTGTGPVLADGFQTSDLTVTLEDAFGNPLVGVTPQVDGSGSGVVANQTCAATDASGVASCPGALSSSLVELVTLQVTSPGAITGATVNFIGLPVLPRGYTSRACGLDMNRDGIIGDPADCNVCDGVTTDPDGDGTAEDLWYIDGSNGSDAASGTPGAPLRTFGEAMARADGPSDGAEDIFCLRGVFTEVFELTQSGVAGFYPRDGVELPNNPLMIVGWDTDNDGSYPPFDTDDVVLLDGSGGGPSGFDNAGFASSYIEIAHLRADAFDKIDASFKGFYDNWTNGTALSHHYMHDIEAQDIARASSTSSDDAAISVGTDANGSVSHMTFSNLRFDDVGGTVFTQWADDTVGSLRNLRYDHIEVSMRGAPLDAVIFMSGRYTSHVEVLDNVIDAQPGLWNADQAVGLEVPTCSNDWIVRGNETTDLGIFAIVDADWYSCEEELLGTVLFDGNLIQKGSHFTQGHPSNWVTIFVHSAHGATAQTIGDVVVTNNTFYSAPGFEVGDHLGIEVGNDVGTQDSWVVVAGNTFYGMQYQGLYMPDDGRPEAQLAAAVAYLNNLAIGSVDDEPLFLAYSPDEFYADGNVYEPNDTLIWDGDYLSFANWLTTTGQDQGSAQCNTSFVGGGSPQPLFPLAAGDTCARGRGVDITLTSFRDVDGDPRPVSGSAAGANIDSGLVDVRFEDHFDRMGADSIRGGWLETEGSFPWVWRLDDQRLEHEGGPAGAPLIAEHAFPPLSSGSIRVMAFMYLARDPSDTSFEVNVQLLEGAAASPTNPDSGAVAYLRWGDSGSGLSSTGGLGVVTGAGVNELLVVDQTWVPIVFTVDLDNSTYDVDVGGVTQTGIPFFSAATPDTIRFWVEDSVGVHRFDAVRVEVVP